MNPQGSFFQPLVSCHQIQRPIAWEEQFGRSAALEVEIGFGLGECLLRSAKNNPHCDYVGIEQHWERIHKTLRRIAELQEAGSFPRPLQNIRILKIDARIAFERLFVPRTIDRVCCLFPCPWPKKSHIRHRLFSKEFLKLLNSRLKSNGQVQIVTDFSPYAQWILQQLKGTGFQITQEMITARYDTKFERKWAQGGQEKFFELTLVKKRHVEVPLKEDVLLESYSLKEFDPDRFHFKDEKGEISVIFKEMIFDPRKDKAMVRLVVAEQNLTQYFWAAIVKKGKSWRVCRADGQNVLPTPGIARALRLVYEAVHTISS